MKGLPRQTNQISWDLLS